MPFESLTVTLTFIIILLLTFINTTKDRPCYRKSMIQMALLAVLLRPNNS